MALSLGTAVGYLDLDITRFAAGIDAANASMHRLNGAATSSSDTMTRVGANLSRVGTAMTVGVTLPTIAAGAAAIKASSNFEYAMDRLAAVANTPANQLQKIKNRALELAEQTKYTSSEVADAMYYMGLAGWDTQQIFDGIPGVLALGAASGEDLSRVSDIVTDSLTAFGKTAEDTSEFVNVLAEATRSSNTDVDQLGTAFKYVAPVAGAFGYSIQDTSIALGIMANNGVKSSQAGTALRQALNQLINPSDKAIAQMQKYNLSLFNADGSSKDLMTVMQQMRSRFKDLSIDVVDVNGEMMEGEQILEMYGHALPTSQMEKLTAITQIFGVRALPAMLAIINSSDEKFNELTQRIYGAQGATDGLGTAFQMQSQMMDNLKGDWYVFTSTLNTAAVRIGDIANGALREFLQALTNLLRAFNEMSPAQQEMIVKMTLYAAVIGPVLLILGKLISSVKLIGSLFTGLGGGIAKLIGLFTGSAGLSTAAKTAAVGVETVGVAAAKSGGLLSSFGGIIKGIGTGVFGALKTAVGGLATGLSGLGSVVSTVGSVAFGGLKAAGSALIGGLSSVGSAVGGLATSAFGGLTSALSAAGSGIMGVVSTLGGPLTLGIAGAATGIGLLVTHWDDVKAAVGKAGKAIGDWASDVGKTIGNWASDVGKTFGNAFDSIKKWGSDVSSKAREIGGNVIKAVGDFFGQVPEKVGSFFGNAFNTVKEWGSNVFSTIREVGGNVVKSVGDFFGQVPQKVGDFFGNAFNTIRDWGGNVLNKIGEVGGNVVKSVGDFFGQVPQKIGDFFGNAFNKAKEFGSNMLNKASEIGKGFVDNVSGFFSKIPEKVGGFFNSAVEAGKNIVGGIANGLKSAGSAIWNGISSAGNAIVNGFKNFFGIHSPSTLMNKVIGVFLPPGIANGFKAAMPEALKSMQKDLSKSVDKLGDGVDEVDVEPKVNITENILNFTDVLKDVYGKVVSWFEDIEQRLSISILSMTDGLRQVISLGEIINTPNMYDIAKVSFVKEDTGRKQEQYQDKPVQQGPVTNNFNFYTDEPLNEIETARLFKKTQQDIAEGFVF